MTEQPRVYIPAPSNPLAAALERLDAAECGLELAVIQKLFEDMDDIQSAEAGMADMAHLRQRLEVLHGQIGRFLAGEYGEVGDV